MKRLTKIVLATLLGLSSACRQDIGDDDDGLQTPLIDATEPIGSICTPPPGGIAEVTGTAYGVETPWDTEPAQAVFRSTSFPSIEIATVIEIERDCSLIRSSSHVQILLYEELVGLGSFDVRDEGPNQVFFGNSEGTFGGPSANGTVSLLGYDPATFALCGAFDVGFADGAGGRLTGTFQAFSYCE